MEDEWIVRLLEVTTGEAPPRWQSCRWEYPEAVLLAMRRKGAMVAKWLRKRQAVIGPYRLSLREMADTASWDRRESLWAGGVHEPLVWPSEVWRLARNENLANPYSELISSTSPSFVSFEVAAACLLGVELTGWNLSGNEFVVRRRDDRGRLATVHVHPTEVRMRVEGRRLRGGLVELAGNQPGPVVGLTRNASRTVRFALPNGLPDGAWIVLRQGDEWLDRKFLSWPYQRFDQGGVEFSVEPSTRLEVLVATGEGPTTELKEFLPGDDDAGKRKIMKTVAAFANGAGGSIAFGVSDELEVVGLSYSESGPKARDRLAGLVRSWVDPLPIFRIDVLPVPDLTDRRVLVLEVDAGDNPPYAAGTRPTNYIYYLRRGGNSYPVTPSEVGALMRSRTPDQPDPFSGLSRPRGRF
ncbi:MAG: AlbA family DNA-binding domain-containing protein [Gaiellaceae bacterium]